MGTDVPLASIFSLQMKKSWMPTQTLIYLAMTQVLKTQIPQTRPKPKSAFVRYQATQLQKPCASWASLQTIPLSSSLTVGAHTILCRRGSSGT